MLDMYSYENKPVWFIADADAGCNAALAEAVLASGQPAALAARDPRRLDAIVNRYSHGACALALDVTLAASIDAAVAQAEARFGRIDVLVGSAMHAPRHVGAVEEGDDVTMRALFDANVFGPVNLARRVLPGMRMRRSGHIALLAAAALPTPAGAGFGHAARAALEALAEALFHEVEPLGIGVTLVDAGGDTAPATTAAAIPDYAGLAARRMRPVAASSAGGVDPARAAQAIMGAVAAGRGPLRLVLGRAALQRAYDRLRVLKVGLDAWAGLTASADAVDAADRAAGRPRGRRAAGSGAAASSSTSAGTDAQTVG